MNMKKSLVKILVVTMVFSLFAVTTVSVNASDETDPPVKIIVQK